MYCPYLKKQNKQKKNQKQTKQKNLTQKQTKKTTKTKTIKKLKKKLPDIGYLPCMLFSENCKDVCLNLEMLSFSTFSICYPHACFIYCLFIVFPACQQQRLRLLHLEKL